MLVQFVTCHGAFPGPCHPEPPWGRSGTCFAYTGRMAADAKLELHKKLESLHDLQGQAKEVVEKIKTSSSEAWNDAKKGIEDSWTKISTAVETAWSKVA